jgi:hypothetical protein
MAGRSEALVAVRAYEIWEKQGRPHGRDREHWLQAVAALGEIETQRRPKLGLKLAAKPAAAGTVPKVKKKAQ